MTCGNALIGLGGFLAIMVVEVLREIDERAFNNETIFVLRDTEAFVQGTRLAESGHEGV